MNNSFAQLVQSAKQDSVSMENVIAKMNPLLKKYSKKAFFLDKDDAYQELILELIEAVMRIDICKTDGECLIYLKNAIYYKFVHLCRDNAQNNTYIDSYATFPNDISADVESSIYDLIIDLNAINLSLNPATKEIFNLICAEYSDSEIASITGYTRQYINKVRRKLRSVLS